jgi:hypothetical protein
MTNLNLTDMETCTKVFKREVIQDVELAEDRFGFEPETTAKVALCDNRFYEVGILLWPHLRQRKEDWLARRCPSGVGNREKCTIS